VSRKKKDERRAEKITQIYDEEPVTPIIFNERRKAPIAFKRGKEWHCGNETCGEPLLWDMGEGRFKCGHCWHDYYL